MVSNSDARTPDEDADAIEQLKRAHESGVWEDDDPNSPFSSSEDGSGDFAMPTSSSITIVVDEDSLTSETPEDR